MKKIKLIFLVLGLLLAVSNELSAQIQPDQARTDEMRRKGPCSDPWISWAYIDSSAGTDAAAGFGTYAQCNPKWYNNGSWSSYKELFNAVKEYPNSLYQAGIRYRTNFQSDGSVAFVADVDGKTYGTIIRGLKRGTNGKVFELIGNDSGGLIGNDGSTLVAAGGGNMVAAGGGNLAPTSSGTYMLQSGEKKRIKVGRNTYLVVR